MEIMVEFLICVIIIGTIVAVIFYNERAKERHREEVEEMREMWRRADERKRLEQEQKDRELLENAHRMLLLTEVRRQAEIVGDSATIDSIDAMKYEGPLPELRDDGAYLSIYDNLRILKIAGMKYRGDLSAYVGRFNGTVVPEPTNEYDPFAIQVKCEDGYLLGYIREDQTQIVRWLVGEPQMVGDEEPTTFKPYRITGFIYDKTDEIDGHQFYDGVIYIKKTELHAETDPLCK